MAKKNRILENIRIEKVGFGGVGISHNQEGKTIIISGGVLPGMIVDVKILKNKKDFIQTQLIKIKSGNVDFSKVKLCKHHMVYDTNIFTDNSDKNFAKVGCGGCKWQILSYNEQLKLKEQIVKDSFAGCDFFSSTYTGIVPSNHIFNYRNKMEFSFGKYVINKVPKDGFKQKEVLSNWSLGFHKQGQFSKIVDINDCLIAGDKINEIFSYLKLILKQSGLPVYDQFNHTGCFRHLVIRQGFNTGQILVNLVIASKYLQENKGRISRWTKLQNLLLQDKFLKQKVNTFLIIENNGLADVVKGQDIIVKPLWGGGYIFEKLIFDQLSDEGKLEVTFRISAFSFFQTNTLQAQVLFSTARKMLPKIKGNILDLYCGAGTIGISLLKLGIGEKLLGVEIVQDAVSDAYKNAEINRLLDRANFIADKAENINFEAENIGLVVIDPPRSGLHKNVIKFLIDLKSKFNFPLLYISCNPVTMARDLKLLTQGNFSVKQLKAVDMFPHTYHIEMIGLLK